MADKPKTYPQKIQELTQQLADKDDRLAAQMEALARIPELEAENQLLKDQLAEEAGAVRKSNISDRTQWTDLEQRAISAEQKANTAQKANAVLQSEVEALENQLTSLRQARSDGQTERTISDLENARTVAVQNATVTSNRLRDVELEFEQYRAVTERQLNELRSHRQQLSAFIDSQSSEASEKVRVAEEQLEMALTELQAVRHSYEAMQAKLIHIQRVLSKAPDVLSELKGIAGVS